MTMTEDIVNEICEAGTELFPNENKFFIIHDCISGVTDEEDGFYLYGEKIKRGVTDEESGFYSYGEKIKLIDVELSIEAQVFICDVDWLNKNMGLLFLVNNKTIEMYFCSESCDDFDFDPELKFVFKRTFDGLFD